MLNMAYRLNVIILLNKLHTITELPITNHIDLPVRRYYDFFQNFHFNQSQKCVLDHKRHACRVVKEEGR